MAVAYTHHEPQRACRRAPPSPATAFVASTPREVAPPATITPMPGPTHRSARARGGPSERRAGAHRPRRTRQAAKRRAGARRVSWSRRLGLAGALVLLVGGSIAFAGGALNTSDGAGATATGPALPAPTILTPARTLTRDATIDLTLLRPTGLDPDAHFRLRIEVNGVPEREVRLPGQEQIVIGGVALAEGDNVIHAVLVGDTGVGAASTPLTITRDSTAPVIRVSGPEPGATVYSATDTLRGRTEAGATISVVDAQSGAPFDATVDPDGRFRADLTLDLGANELLLSSRDPAGNQASVHVTLIRADSMSALTLTVTASTLKAAELPQRLGASVFIQDERGQPASGAQVTFSLSPPNSTTMTYRTTSAAGWATWPELDIATADDPHGVWLLTVLAVLPSGGELRASKTVTVR